MALAWTTKQLDIGPSQVCYYRRGSGEPLLLLHGWPFSGLTFRTLLPQLVSRFDCIAVDLPGAGDTVTSARTRFEFPEQARSVLKFMRQLDIERFSILAHDTGATLARLIALEAPMRVRRMVLLNTEIPGHRPPWIPFYQRVLQLRVSRYLMQRAMAVPSLVRSSMVFGGCFADEARLSGEFHRLFVEPLIHDSARVLGYARYIRGFDWQVLDGLRERHRSIFQPTLFVWGEDDPTFPIARGREMAGQLPGCRGFIAVRNAKLLVHEERPDLVARFAREFLLEGAMPAGSSE